MWRLLEKKIGCGRKFEMHMNIYFVIFCFFFFSLLSFFFCFNFRYRNFEWSHNYTISLFSHFSIKTNLLFLWNIYWNFAFRKIHCLSGNYTIFRFDWENKNNINYSVNGPRKRFKSNAISSQLILWYDESARSENCWPQIALIEVRLTQQCEFSGLQSYSLLGEHFSPKIARSHQQITESHAFNRLLTNE